MAERRSESAVATAAPEREIVITRVVNAPRERVWEAWTDAEQIAKWWGPQGFTTTIHMMDVRPGGVWRHTMHGPNGVDYQNFSTFTEVVKPERIVFSHGGGKKDGPVIQFDMTWTFEAMGNQTRVTIRQVYASAEERDRMAKEVHAIEGGNQTLARLDEYVAQPGNNAASPREREIVIERIFDAPRELVFQAWTDPKHLAKWFGPKNFTIPVCRVDANVGSPWNMVMRSPDGQDFPCGGVYYEVRPPERLVFTNNALDREGNPIINGHTTVIFAEHEGKTKLILRTRGTAMVDYAVNYLKGMEAGWTQSLEKLTELLATL